MFLKKKCPSCGAKNPKDATACISCSAPFELRMVEIEYDGAIHRIPQDALDYFNRGNTYHKRRMHEEAIEDFDKAIQLYSQYFLPDDDLANLLLAQAYLHRGRAYSELGSKAEAIADFEKCVTLTKNPQWKQMVKQEIEELSK